jgi:predicted DCC family thiol-disulfide oxidoreductase YuxK
MSVERGEGSPATTASTAFHEPDALVLFDGVCGFCNAAVRFIARRDRRGRFAFAALDSAAGRAALARAGAGARRPSARVPTESSAPASLVLVEPDGRVLERSAAALRIARGLAFPWPLAWILVLVPRPLRDAAYDAFARRRYRWFGRLDACPLPPPELRDRFLDGGG